jgi:hypothetical protein
LVSRWWRNDVRTQWWFLACIQKPVARHVECCLSARQVSLCDNSAYVSVVIANRSRHGHLIQHSCPLDVRFETGVTQCFSVALRRAFRGMRVTTLRRLCDVLSTGSSSSSPLDDNHFFEKSGGTHQVTGFEALFESCAPTAEECRPPECGAADARGSQGSLPLAIPMKAHPARALSPVRSATVLQQRDRHRLPSGGFLP